MREALTSSIRDLAKVLQGHNISINQGATNNGEESSIRPVRTSKPPHQIFRDKFLQKDEQSVEEIPSDVDEWKHGIK
ncbi:hypothetical protein KI387_006302, partial [Taxus chinensis]